MQDQQQTDESRRRSLRPLPALSASGAGSRGSPIPKSSTLTFPLRPPRGGLVGTNPTTVSVARVSASHDRDRQAQTRRFNMQVRSKRFDMRTSDSGGTHRSRNGVFFQKLPTSKAVLGAFKQAWPPVSLLRPATTQLEARQLRAENEKLSTLLAIQQQHMSAQWKDCKRQNETAQRTVQTARAENAKLLNELENLKGANITQNTPNSSASELVAGINTETVSQGGKGQGEGDIISSKDELENLRKELAATKEELATLKQDMVAVNASRSSGVIIDCHSVRLNTLCK